MIRNLRSRSDWYGTGAIPSFNVKNPLTALVAGGNLRLRLGVADKFETSLTLPDTRFDMA